MNAMHVVKSLVEKPLSFNLILENLSIYYIKGDDDNYETRTIKRFKRRTNR